MVAEFGVVGVPRYCVDATQELELKPIDLCRLICAELSLVLPSSKPTRPKDIVALARAKLHLHLQEIGDGRCAQPPSLTKVSQQEHGDDRGNVGDHVVSSRAVPVATSFEEEEDAVLGATTTRTLRTSGTNASTSTTTSGISVDRPPVGGIIDDINTPKLILATTTTTVKDDASAIRQVIRSLPPSFWGSDTITSQSTPEALVRRLLLQPPSVGGFCTGIACKRLPTNKKAIDTKSIYSQGDSGIHDFSILSAPGQYSTLDTEMEQLPLLVLTQRDVIKFHQTVFVVQRRETGTNNSKSSQSVMLVGKGTKCPVARMVILLTSKFCLVGFYHHHNTPGGAANNNFESERHALEMMEQIRLEATATGVASSS